MAGTTTALIPEQRRAAYRPPPGSCDVHAHVYGPFDGFPVRGARTVAETPVEAYLRTREVQGFDRGLPHPAESSRDR